ncbi:DUF167 domain-containing protein [Herbaspirillum autotrophicum]|uniref:DUF167 domain-containing protein n=1 Tax=Herbaspirillum autotrophicum TaxID=180195 RepID=UPI00067CCE02|nr:DUF167 domain-containing protein [Herbaspirillum autotrophicum]
MSETGWCSTVPAGIRLAVQITANAKKTEVLGPFDAVLKIRLQAQPIEGKANLALIRYLAETLDVPRSAVVLTHGQSNKRKLLEIRSGGLTASAVVARLWPAAAA